MTDSQAPAPKPGTKEFWRLHCGLCAGGALTMGQPACRIMEDFARRMERYGHPLTEAEKAQEAARLHRVAAEYWTRCSCGWTGRQH